MGRPTTLSQCFLHLRMGRSDKVQDLQANKVPPHREPGVDVDAWPMVTPPCALASAEPLHRQPRSHRPR